MESPAQTTVSPEQVRSAAAKAVASDPKIAALLERKARGEKLNAIENGTIGAWMAKEKLKGLVGSKPAPLANDAPTAAQSASNGLVSQPCDPALAASVTATVLDKSDSVATRWIGRHAKKAGASGPVLDRFLHSASLSASDRDMIKKLSPHIFEQLELDPRKAALYIVGGVLGLHALNLWQCVEELKDLQAGENSRRAEALKNGQVRESTVTGPLINPTIQPHKPVRPKGAPPDVT